MKKADYIVLLTICWSLIVISHVGADSEVKVIPKTRSDPKVISTLNDKGDLNVKADGLGLAVDSIKDDHVKDGNDEVSESEKGVEINKLKEVSGDQKQISSEKGNIQGKEKDDGVKKKKPEKGIETKEGPKEVEDLSPPVRKEGSHAEGCDLSTSCRVDKVGLVACLKVPGNESPELWLLVQNKGKGPLSVTISAPDFVQLEKTQIQLKENDENKVKVSITKTGTGNTINLTAGKGYCTLDFQGLITLNPNKDKVVSSTESINSMNATKRISLIALFVFGPMVLAASTLICINFRRKHLARKNSKYQNLDMGLPVVGGAKGELVPNNGWDNTWGDDWDDEEAPKMPALPLLSSKGLAPRKLNKDGWKD